MTKSRWLRAKAATKAALALYFLTIAPGHAETSGEPFLPKCGHAEQQLTPVLRWSGLVQEIPGLIAERVSDTEQVAYLTYAVAAHDVSVEETDVAYSVSISPKADDAKRLKVIFWGKPQFANGYYFFSGFYGLEAQPKDDLPVVFRQLDTFDIVSSRRFCIADAASRLRAALHAPPRPPVAAAPGLPPCASAREARIPIPAWEPHVTGERHVHVGRPPPLGDGRIVYISIDNLNGQCPRDADHLFTIERPQNENDGRGAGALAINLRGNFAPHRDGCRLQGFYMNQPVYGIHQGWTETYFAPIDKKRIQATGQYCLARQVIH